MNQKETKKLKILASVLEPNSTGLAQELFDLSEEQEKLTERVDQLDETITDQTSKLKAELDTAVETFRKEKGEKGDKGDKGDPGKDYVLEAKDKKEIAALIKVPVVEKVIEKTEVIKEQPIEIIKEVAVVNEEAIADKIKNDLPALGERIRDGLELLQGEDRLDKKAVRGIEEIEQRLEQVQQIKGGNGGNKSVYLYVGGQKKGLVNAVDIKAGTGATVTHSKVNGLDTITVAAEGGTTEETDPIFTASEAKNFAAGDKAKLDTHEGYLNQAVKTTSSPSFVEVKKIANFALTYTASQLTRKAITGGATYDFTYNADGTLNTKTDGIKTWTYSYSSGILSGCVVT